MKKKKIWIGIIVVVSLLAITFIYKHYRNENKDNKQVIFQTKYYEGTVNLDDFIIMVLMKEMPENTNKELIKAQSVIIRTYILKKMNGRNIITSKELGLDYATTSELKKMWFEEFRRKEADTYMGILCNLTGFGERYVFTQKFTRLKNTLMETKNIVMSKNSKLVLPLFHEISNGKTTSGKEILGQNYSYLKSVNTADDLIDKNCITKKIFNVWEFKSRLKNNKIVIYKGTNEVLVQSNEEIIKSIESGKYDHRDSTNHVIYLKIGDTWIRGDVFIKVLGLKSTDFQIKVENNKIIFTTRGVGHNMGMSLNYGKKLSKMGYNWKKIIKFFYDVDLCKY